MLDTKEKILQTSLYLFALDGYNGVSVSNIADEIDLSKGAVYKHFKSKREIFNSIVERMKELDEKNLPELNLPKKENFEPLNEYLIKMYDIIKEQTVSFYKFWTEEPFARDFRRMIMLEQFRNPEMNDLYQKYLVKGPLKQFEKIFASLPYKNAERIAFEYYSQVYFLISLSDSSESKESSESVLQDKLKEFGERYIYIKQVLPKVPPKPQVPKQIVQKQKAKGLLQLAQEING